MTKIFSLLTIFILVLLPFSSMAKEVDVSGDWELTIKTPRGERTQDIHFDQDGENLTVTMTDPRGNEIKGEGTIKENKIEWAITRSTPRGEMTLSYSGEVEGNTMSGEVQFGNFGTFEWEATKKEN